MTLDDWTRDETDRSSVLVEVLVQRDTPCAVRSCAQPASATAASGGVGAG